MNMRTHPKDFNHWRQLAELGITRSPLGDIEDEEYIHALVQSFHVNTLLFGSVEAIGQSLKDKRQRSICKNEDIVYASYLEMDLIDSSSLTEGEKRIEKAKVAMRASGLIMQQAVRCLF